MSLNTLIGREHEQRALLGFIEQKRSVLILGDEGVGKSAILEDVVAASPVKNILYSRHSVTLKETLVNFIGFALGRKDVQKKNILSLKKLCYALLDASPDYAVLDHIGWVEPKFYGFLTYVKERGIPFIVATRRPGKKSVGHLWMGLYDFETLEIKNLDPRRSDQLVEYYASVFNLKIAADSDFKKDIFKFSRGNPKIIKELCELARDDRYRTKGYIDVKLMDLDRRIQSAVS
ncbi:MAG TPA: ATP-binding protein [Methylomirabilota bacterium]|nr:ATP-binding protein [Methylomirabilota bacterium]